MNVLDKQLTGLNFCGLSCVEQQSIIHPQTCINQVLISNEGNKNLVDWFNCVDTEDDPIALPFEKSKSMLDWLRFNYPKDTIDPASLPVASDTTKGILKINIDNNYLTITNGILAFNDAILPIVGTSTYDTLGKIGLGNKSVIKENFSDIDLEEELVTYTVSTNTAYCFPLRLDENSRAGIVIPTELFTQIQSNWNQSDSSALDYIKNKPSVFTTSANGLVPNPGSTSGKFLKDDGTWTTPTNTTYTSGNHISIDNNIVNIQEVAYNSEILTNQPIININGQDYIEADASQVSNITFDIAKDHNMESTIVLKSFNNNGTLEFILDGDIDVPGINYIISFKADNSKSISAYSQPYTVENSSIVIIKLSQKIATIYEYTQV